MNKQRFLTTLNIIRLKLIGKALRAFPSSPKQKEIQARRAEVENLMRHLGYQFTR